jgi:hypothetical protein
MPCGLNFALATDGPGFTCEDGPPDARLSLPPWLEPQRVFIERRLKKRSPRKRNQD